MKHDDVNWLSLNRKKFASSFVLLFNSFLVKYFALQIVLNTVYTIVRTLFAYRALFFVVYSFFALSELKLSHKTYNAGGRGLEPQTGPTLRVLK